MSRCVLHILARSPDNIFSPNDVLLDQTMLCESARLLRGYPEGEAFENFVRRFWDTDYYLTFEGEDSWFPSNTERLFNLSMLLDGLALHDRIYVLKSELPPDAPSLELRQILIKKGILREIETIPYAPQIRKEFDIYLSKLDLDQQRVAFSRQEVAKFIPDVVDNFLQGKHEPRSKNDLLIGLEREYETTLSHWWLNSHRNDLTVRPFFVLGNHMLDLVKHYYSGGAFEGVSHLRTFVYWRISEHAGIPLYPSSRRIPQLDAFADHIRLSAAEKIYQVIAESFKEEIELVYEDEAQVPLFLPPSLSIFFDLYRSSHDLPTVIDNFRSEFTGIRQDFQSLQVKLAKARTLQERIEVKRELSKVTELVKAHYRLNEDSFLETVLGFAPEVLHPLSNPADPSKYSKELLTKPVEWIKDWWRRRSLRHVFRLRKRLYQIAEYEQLASQVLGVQFDEKANQDFYKHYSKYLALYQRRD